ncbi:MAG: VCBS repeat-containing protein, partial [Bacteroidia bacterium]
MLYNNPDLVTDLGVGLWAWPLPMDYDSDGDNDLVVSCPDVPYNGIYFFENITGHSEKPPLFAPPVRIADGARHLQVCFVNGEPRVLGRGVEYQNFRKAGLSEPKALFPFDSLEKPFTRVRFSQCKYVDYENDGDFDIIVGFDHWGDYGWDNAFDSLGNWVNGPLHGYIFLLENTGERFDNRGMITAGGRPIDVYGAPTPCMQDFDGDGDLDIICGEFIDRLTWFENIGTRENPQFAEGRFISNEEGVIKMDLQMIIPASIDWDGDGDIDLIVGDEDGRVALIENRGVVKDSMPLFISPVYFRQQAGLLKFGALSTPFSVDWDDDGDEDLICGNTAGQIAFIENLDGGDPPQWAAPVLLEAEGEPVRIMAGMNGSIQGPAERKWGYTVLTVADWDNDGLNDIIVNSIWGKVLWFRNNGVKGSPSLEDARPVAVAWEGDPPYPAWFWWKPADGQLVTQWRTTPYATDWNGYGLTDLIM